MSDRIDSQSSSTLGEQLAIACRACNASGPRGRVRTVASIPAGRADAWRVGERVAAQLGERLVALWHDPRRDLSLAAVGIASAVTCDAGADRFAAVQQALDGWQAGWASVGEPADWLPWAPGGMAFAPGALSNPAPAAASATPELHVPDWHDWPAAWFCLPHVLIATHKGRLAVAACVNDDADATAVGAALDAALVEPPAAPAPDTWIAVGMDGETANAARQDWIGRVDHAVRTIRAGEAGKLVLARAETVARSSGDASAVAVAHRLREQQPGCFTYMVAPLPHAAMVGATPERLVRVAGTQVETMALAGTRRYSAGDLLVSDKDRVEHAAVSDAIADALRPIVSDLSVGDRHASRFGDIVHIETPIAATLDQAVGALGLLQRLHPTPAVGGVPRLTALRWLTTHEGLDRGWYAAPVGWLSPGGNGDFAVALRCALLRAGTATAFAGAGIVAASDPAAEWEETTWKLDPIRHALGVAATTDTVLDAAPVELRRELSTR